MTKLEKLEALVRTAYESKSPERAEWADWLFANHVFVVADIAERLANRFGAPVDQARAAAVLHDIADATMSRFAPDHEQVSLDTARQLLEEAGFSQAEITVIVDDAIRLHSCLDGKKPKSLIGNILSTADALAHLTTNFYVYTTQNLMLDKTEPERKSWAMKKMLRDYEDKIAFEEIRNEVKPTFEKLSSLLAVAEQ